PADASAAGSLRRLIPMKSAERERTLAEKSEDQTKFIQAKLREYDTLAPQEREHRLRLLQLHWHLAPLMRLAPTERGERLALVPAEDRKIVVDRLAQWDRLPADIQKDVLSNLSVMRLSDRLDASTPIQREVVLQTFSPEQRRKL